MATASAPRLELPGLDTSPDVYETALDDDATNRSSPPLPSESSATSDDEEEEGEEEEEEDDDEVGRVSRRRLHVSGARLRFGEQSRAIETTGADLSDRVDGRRKGYTVRRGGPTRDDDDESLEAKIARLRREVEECRAEAERQQQQQQQKGKEGSGDDHVDATAKLCAMLADAQLPDKARRTRGHGRNQSESVFHDAPTTATPDPGDAAGTTDEHTLAAVAAFDQRLAALEAALGMASLDSVTDADVASTPLLPTLTLLDQQLASLTTAASLSALEQAASRVQKLKAEAQNLAQLQRAAVSAKSTPVGSDDDEESEAPALLSSDDMKRLETLYTLLPSLQSLSPTVPPLITRLRSLRTLHAAAANAAQDLDDVEARQAEMDKELKMWREGLQKVEEAVQQHGEANGRNGNFVKGWVEELEGRVQALGR